MLYVWIGLTLRRVDIGNFYNTEYALLSINISLDDTMWIQHYIHTQVDVGDKHNSIYGMDPCFEHDDKNLYVLDTIIVPNKITVVGKYISDVDNRGRLTIKNG
jgi:hypothetical protein